MFTKLLDALKATRRTIVFTEGPDARILEATDRLLKDDLMDVLLVGNVEEVKANANIPAMQRSEAIRRAADWVIEHSTIEEK